MIAAAFLLSSAASFAMPHKSSIRPSVLGSPWQRKVNHPSSVLHESVSEGSTEETSAFQQRPNVPNFVYTLNSSTKWLVTLAVCAGLVTRLKHYDAPFICVGSILSTYIVDWLKGVINHDRPAGAPFTEPGMPSAHASVSFFLAAAWSSLILSRTATTTASLALYVSATVVAVLRVVCGYHSVPQIGVGAIIGTAFGVAWAKLGLAASAAINPQVLHWSCWSTYGLASVVYAITTMRSWLGENKHL